MGTATKAPVHEERHGRIGTAVWRNEGNGRPYYNTTLRKSWKDGDQWKASSANLKRDNLLPAAKLLDWADTAIGQAVEKGIRAEGKKPIAAKARGRLEVAVFQQDNDGTTSYAVRLKRSFKDGDTWKDTALWLMADDCLPAACLLTRTFSAIDRLAAESSGALGDKETIHASEPGDDDVPF